MKQRQPKDVLVIAIYSHIEAYPPSLNALHHLSSIFKEVHILYRNVLRNDWTYPANVFLIPFEEYIEAEKVKNLPIRKKIGSFLKFGFTLKSLVKQKEPSLILAYDAPAFSLLNLFSWHAIRRLSSKVWYHNHDVMLESELPRYSLMWMIRKLEIRYFHRATYFSLPTKARLPYFPVKVLRHQPFIIPNFPSRYFYGGYNAQDPSQENVVKMIFQGQISQSNGIDAFVKLLPHHVRGKRVELHLAGPIDTGYHNELLALANGLGVSDRVFFYGRLPYSKLPALTASCHVGFAVYGSHNTMVRTMSTASNKIFEYASVGLPVILNKRADMQTEFSEYSWIHFAELTSDELLRALDSIIASYTEHSRAAKSDFEENLNFEKYFCPVLNFVKQAHRDTKVLL